MANATLTIKINIPWWVRAYVNARVFIANAFNVKIDTEKLAEFAANKSKMKVK